jgi:hypothetical protein
VKTEKEITELIKEIQEGNKHVLVGDRSTLVENAPRALMQLSAESRLDTLYWVLEKLYKSKLKRQR